MHPTATTCRNRLLAGVRQLFDEAQQLGVKPSEIGIVLSGGVDTCAIMEACSVLDTFPAKALTVFVSDEATDLNYAPKIAEQYKIPYHPFRISPEELLREALPFTVKTLGSFDGMQLRNSVVVAFVLQKARELGLKYVITGDASDELMGGYSFTWGSDDPVWTQKRNEMCAEWLFSGPILAKKLGITAASPYCLDTFKEWALTTSKEDCIGERPIELRPGMPREMHITGKIPLREAFPDGLSAWRRKDPIEIGSGSTMLGKGYFDEKLKTEGVDLDRAKADAQATHHVEIRDAEHYVYFQEFLRQFPSFSCADVIPTRSIGAENSCIKCGFDLYNKTAMFCRVCGAWPARSTKKDQP